MAHTITAKIELHPEYRSKGTAIVGSGEERAKFEVTRMSKVIEIIDIVSSQYGNTIDDVMRVVVSEGINIASIKSLTYKSRG